MDAKFAYEERKRTKEGLARKKALKKFSKTLFVWFVVIFLILFFGGGTLVSLLERPRFEPSVDTPATGTDREGTAYPDQGRAHVPDGTVVEYNSNPPTSGPHYAVPADWGAHNRELADGALVHNLEHCGIWISYRADIAAQERSKLIEFARGFATKIIVTPRAANDSPIAFAAWTRLLTMEAFNEDDAIAFIVAHLNRTGPECNAN